MTAPDYTHDLALSALVPVLMSVLLNAKNLSSSHPLSTYDGAAEMLTDFSRVAVNLNQKWGSVEILAARQKAEAILREWTHPKPEIVTGLRGKVIGMFASSSNGKTSAFEAEDAGSTPAEAASACFWCGQPCEHPNDNYCSTRCSVMAACEGA